MYPTEFTPWLSLFGGMLIGLSAIGLMLFNGRIAGISGIVKGAMFDKTDRAWRLLFVLGLIFGGIVCFQFTPYTFEYRQGFPKVLIVLGGLLVGLGTALGSGCTSGHGVCGISRFSTRSIVATVVYFLVGILAAVITNKLFL